MMWNGMLAGGLGLVSAAVSVMAAPAPIRIGDSLIDPKALTIQGSFGQAINGKSFQQDALVSHRGHQYVAYYDERRHVCIARRKLPSGPWDVLRFQDYDFKSDDAHNTISMGICPRDGTLHLAFDHHCHPLHYRVSRKGAVSQPEATAWNAQLFGPVLSELETGKRIAITYPRFWQTPDGGLQFGYRRGVSGDGDRMLVDYDADRGVWTGTRQIDSGKGDFEGSDSRCSYPNGYTYGPDGRLHATWVWREGPQTANHDLMYAWSEDRGRTWLNNRGERVKDPPAVGTPGIKVVDIGADYGLMNTHGQAVDSQNRIHTVMWHCSDASLRAAGSRPGETRWGPEKARRYHHYWRDGSAVWQHRELPWIAGDRPKLFMDAKDNAVLVFNTGEKLAIAVATAATVWSDWRIIHTEDGPFGNEMLGDLARWKETGVLSIMAQGAPAKLRDPTPLRVLDFGPFPLGDI